VFNVIRFDPNDTDHKHKCGVGILKCFATQPHLVVNQVAIVTDIVQHEETDNKFISSIQQKCKHAIITFLDGNTCVTSYTRAHDFTSSHSDSSDDDSESD
jgi:hypothetical protein